VPIAIVTTDNIDQVVEEHDVVVLDFWAEWCGPCIEFSDTFEKVASQFPDVFFASIDVDKEKQLAKDFNIHSVPSVMILRERVAVFSESGKMPESALIELIKQTNALDMSPLKDQIASKEGGEKDKS